jgi:hypothetical protein
LLDVEQRHPGAIESQWIPTDRALWQVDCYRDFLAARRELLAVAANGFLNDLRHGTGADAEPLPRTGVADDLDERAVEVRQLAKRLEDDGCVSPSYDEEIVDPTDGRVLMVAEAFWPSGLRAGLGEPVVLELDTLGDRDLARLEELGYKVFTDGRALEGFVRNANDVASGDLLDDSEPTSTDERPTTPPTTSATPSTSSPVREEPSVSQAEAAFGRAMTEIYRRAKAEAGYNATLFLRMLSDHGPVDTAHRLINSSQPSDGFTHLWERGRLDLTVEAHVLRPEFDVLFTDEERDACRARLSDYGFTGA